MKHQILLSIAVATMIVCSVQANTITTTYADENAYLAGVGTSSLDSDALRFGDAMATTLVINGKVTATMEQIVATATTESKGYPPSVREEFVKIATCECCVKMNEIIAYHNATVIDGHMTPEQVKAFMSGH